MFAFWSYHGVGNTQLRNTDQFFGLFFRIWSKEQVPRNHHSVRSMVQNKTWGFFSNFLSSVPFTHPPSVLPRQKSHCGYPITQLIWELLCSTVFRGLKEGDKWECVSVASPCLIWLMPLRACFCSYYTSRSRLLRRRSPLGLEMGNPNCLGAVLMGWKKTESPRKDDC